MIRISKIDYHRNGVSGEGFYAITFEDLERNDHLLVATVFAESGYVAVLDTHLLMQNVVEFGRNSFRGDYYEPELRQAIKKYESEQANG